MGSHKLIGIVEDDPDLSEIIVDFLQLVGYSCKVFHKPTLALSAIENGEKFSLIIADIGLPEFDGFEMIDRVRKLGISLLPFLMITGFDDQSHRIKADRLGVKTILRKPFGLKELQSAITQLI